MQRSALLLPLLLALPTVALACGGDDDGAGAAASSTTAAEAACDVVGDTDEPPASDLAVSLDEFSVTTGDAVAGNVHLVVENDGDVEHELVIDRVGGDRIGEIEPFASGATCEGTFTLEAGTYTLFCEIVDESGTSHEQAGMVTDLTVK